MKRVLTLWAALGVMYVAMETSSSLYITYFLLFCTELFIMKQFMLFSFQKSLIQ